MEYFDEHKVLRDFLAGDKDALRLIYKQYVKELFSYGIGLGFNKETIKDAVHDLFFKLLSKPEYLQGINNIKYFLLRSLKNGLLNISRSSTREDYIENYAHTFTNKITILDQLIDEENRILIEKKLNLF